MAQSNPLLYTILVVKVLDFNYSGKIAMRPLVRYFKGVQGEPCTKTLCSLSFVSGEPCTKNGVIIEM